MKEYWVGAARSTDPRDRLIHEGLNSDDPAFRDWARREYLRDIFEGPPEIRDQVVSPEARDAIERDLLEITFEHGGTLIRDS